MAKLKKSRLVIAYEFNFWLAGISSSAKPHKLAWEINKEFGLKLVRQPDLIVGFKGGVEKGFLYYEHKGNFNRLKLLKNRTLDEPSGELLVSEYPRFDFIAVVPREPEDKDFPMIEKWRRISQIEMIATIPVEGLKSRSNFIF